MWNCKGSASTESRKHRTKEKKLNSMKIVLPEQDGRGKEAIFSSKQCSQKGKATSGIRSALCLIKLLLHSAAPEVAWHLLSLERLNWRAEVTVLSAGCTWVTERSPVLANSASRALGSTGLWLLNPCGVSGPDPTKA